MEKVVFQSNKVLAFVIWGVLFVVATVAYFKLDFPLLFLGVFFLVGILFLVTTVRSKLVIEDGILRYDKLTRGEEVDLRKAAQIVIREVETIVDRNRDRDRESNRGSGLQVGNVRFGDGSRVDEERKVEKIAYILDEAGRATFSFPADAIRRKDRQRFRDAVQQANPDIEVF